MTVKEVLSTVNTHDYVSIEDGRRFDPLRFGEAKFVFEKMNYQNDNLMNYEVKAIYPEYYKGVYRMGITILIKI